MSYSFLKPAQFFFVFTMETIHVVGIAFLFLIALPELDSLTGLLVLNSVAVIPCILKTIKMNSLASNKTGNEGIKEDKKNKRRNTIFGILSFFIQLASIAAITYIEISWIENVDEIHTPVLIWSLPVGLILTSFGWWECYLTEFGSTEWMWRIRKKMSDGLENDEKVSSNVLLKFELPFSHTVINIPKLKETNQRSPARGPTYLIISLWKIGIFLALFSVLVPGIGIVSDYNTLYSKFISAFQVNEYQLDGHEISEVLQGSERIWQSKTIIIFIQVTCSWILYSVSKFAIKCNIEKLGFALPMTLITPVSIWTMTPLCVNRAKDACAYTSTFPRFLFFNCPVEQRIYGNWYDNLMFWGLMLLLFLSFFWVSYQIWDEHTKGLLLETPQIFSKYYYTSLLPDISLMLNKRNIKMMDKEGNKINVHEPKIYACATMWHETRLILRNSWLLQN